MENLPSGWSWLWPPWGSRGKCTELTCGVSVVGLSAPPSGESLLVRNDIMGQSWPMIGKGFGGRNIVRCIDVSSPSGALTGANFEKV